MPRENYAEWRNCCRVLGTKPTLNSTLNNIQYYKTVE